MPHLEDAVPGVPVVDLSPYPFVDLSNEQLLEGLPVGAVWALVLLQ